MVSTKREQAVSGGAGTAEVATTERRAIGVVVVPIDFSRASMAALSFAESLVAGSARTLRLLHAVPPSPLEEVVTAQQSLVDVAETRLEDLATPLRRRGLCVETTARTGAPIDLVDVAVGEAHAAGVEPLIVLGDRGLSTLRRAIVGSVADGVLRRNDGPVIVVHEEDEPVDRMGGRMADVASGLMKVAVACGFDRESDEALSAFVELFAPRAARTRVALIHALPELEWVEGTDAPLLRAAYADEVERRRGAELVAIADRLRMRGFEAETCVVRGDPARAILAHATAIRADLIVSGRRHRRMFERILLGSTAEGIVHRAPCAVLTSGLAGGGVAPATSRGPKVAIIA
jgi:nucleotide-binding universal stress UspA family protein